MINFLNDYNDKGHKKVYEFLNRLPQDKMSGYGQDDYTLAVKEKIKKRNWKRWYFSWISSWRNYCKYCRLHQQPKTLWGYCLCKNWPYFHPRNCSHWSYWPQACNYNCWKWKTYSWSFKKRAWTIWSWNKCYSKNRLHFKYKWSRNSLFYWRNKGLA